MPATLSIITNVFPREERAKAIGIWAAMASIGVGLGPLFGGLLLEWFDWTSVFLLNVPVAAVALTLGFVLVPESRDPKPGAFDVIGVGLSVVTLLSLVYGIIEAPESGWTSPLVLGCFAASAAFGAAFVAWELRTKDPMLNLSFFRERSFSVGSLAISLASFALFGAIFALTQFLQDAHGYSALEAGAAMAPIALGLVAGAGSSIKLQERIGTSRVVSGGLVGIGGLLPDLPAVDLRHGLLAARHLVLPPRAVHGLDHGTGDRLGHVGGAGGEVGRRLGDERRDPPGGGGPRHGGDRLADHVPVRVERR